MLINDQQLIITTQITIIIITLFYKQKTIFIYKD